MKFKWILLSPVIVLILVIVFCEVNKAYWDHKVKQWCKADGGVKVYERVELTKDEYESMKSNGMYFVIPAESMAKEGDGFYLSFKTHVIRASNPRVEKTEMNMVRAKDKTILATLIGYGRSGGDLIVIDHPSHFSCAREESQFKEFNSSLHYKG